MRYRRDIFSRKFPSGERTCSSQTRPFARIASGMHAVCLVRYCSKSVRADLSDRCDVCADSTGDARVARAEHPEQCLVAERIGDARERAAISTAWTTFHAEVMRRCHTEVVTVVTWSAVATAAARSPAHQRICHLQLP